MWKRPAKDKKWKNVNIEKEDQTHKRGNIWTITTGKRANINAGILDSFVSNFRSKWRQYKNREIK